MRRVVVVIIALAVPFLGRAADKPTADEAARVELKTLSGTWVAAGGEAKGVEIPKDDLPFRWTFQAGGKAVFAHRKQGIESTFAYTIDASKTPRAIEFTYEGPAAA